MLPEVVEDSDRVNLGSVVQSCLEPKLFTKLIKNFERESGVKVRRVNKNQSNLVW